MNPNAPLDPRLLEALSAYLDGRLEGAEKAALEGRLAREADLSRHLSELRAVRDSLRALPPLKPPRPLTLSRQQAGETARREGWFSSRALALGSALAATAFVFVTSLNLLSGAGMAAAPRAVAEDFTAPSLMQAAEKSAATGAVDYPPPAPLSTSLPPAPTAEAPRAAAGGGGGEMPTVTPEAAETDEAGCGAPSEADAAAEKCGLNGNGADRELASANPRPDFQTLAPYLEFGLGAAAVLLAALAVWTRKKNRW
jgi:hypothetical protein